MGTKNLNITNKKFSLMDLKHKYILLLLLSLILVLCLFLAVSTTTPMSPSLSTKVMDYDYNDDGVIDNADKSLIQNHLGESTSVGSFNRKFDNNYDGVIDESDVNLLDQSKGLELSAIADGMFTGETAFIDDEYRGLLKDKNWDYTLFALDESYVKSYWGSWLDISNRPYSTDYQCVIFATDMMKCSYKDLGYGTIAYAGSNIHSYNIFYTGGDWHDLKNWMILEPQNGMMFRADKPPRNMYKTKYIMFPVYLEQDVEKGMRSIYSITLVVNLDNKTVHKNNGYSNSWKIPNGLEEPSPKDYYTSYHPHQSLAATVANQISAPLG